MDCGDCGGLKKLVSGPIPDAGAIGKEKSGKADTRCFPVVFSPGGPETFRGESKLDLGRFRAAREEGGEDSGDGRFGKTNGGFGGGRSDRG